MQQTQQTTDITSIQTQAIKAFMFAECNMAASKIASMAYPNWDDLHDSYRREKAGLVERQGILVFFSQLDPANRKRLVTGVLDYYREEI